MKNKKQNLTRRQYDQKRVRRCLKRNPTFIDEILALAFDSPEAQVNLYNAFSALRTQERYLDLGAVRYLVGNGLVRVINNLEKGFMFSKGIYMLTRKGAKSIFR